jgi:hypothetical protein
MKTEDKARLRKLAKQVAEIAADPVNEQNKKLWVAVNGLKAPRPLVYVRDYPVFLLQYKDELQTTIEDEFLKGIELQMLIKIYEWNHLRVDRVVENLVECPAVFTDSGFGIEGYSNLASNNVEKEFYDTAKHFDPQIITPDDIEKIKTPVVEYDEAATMDRLNMLKETIGDIIPVKLFGRCHFRCVPMDDIITWMGIDQVMNNLALEPEFMHSVIERYMEAQMSRIKQYESLGLISSNNNSKNIGNNCAGWTDELPPPTETGIGATIGDIWGENADQIMTAVSPAMTEDFSFEHEKAWARQFKLHSYGCCERLDHKLDLLTAAFPNLRKVTASPFNNLNRTVEQLGDRYVISFKPHSVYLAGDQPNFDILRGEIVHVCELAQKQRLNIVLNMKTLITLNNEPQRLWRWCDMATEIVKDYFGDSGRG